MSPVALFRTVWTETAEDAGDAEKKDLGDPCGLCGSRL
jgi:hypothetical protein